jgi:hypothetical protein
VAHSDDHLLINRRVVLAGMGAMGLTMLTGCGKDSKQYALGAGFETQSSIIAGVPQRAPIVLFNMDTAQPERDDPPPTLDIEVWSGGKKLQSATISLHDEEIPTPYYPLIATFTAAGDYELRTKNSSVPVAVRVHDRKDVPLVQVGDKIRSVDTPTTANSLGVTPICTRTPDACPLHDKSLAQLLTTKGPTALLISTPGFCQTQICGPVLELLVSERTNFPNIRMVHAEVYVNPAVSAPPKPNPVVTNAVTTYGLTYEPSLVVANSDGIVTARLDFTWDRAELRAALQSAVS